MSCVELLAFSKNKTTPNSHFGHCVYNQNVNWMSFGVSRIATHTCSSVDGFIFSFAHSTVFSGNLSKSSIKFKASFAIVSLWRVAVFKNRPRLSTPIWTGLRLSAFANCTSKFHDVQTSKSFFFLFCCSKFNIKRVSFLFVALTIVRVCFFGAIHWLGTRKASFFGWSKCFLERAQRGGISGAICDTLNESQYYLIMAIYCFHSYFERCNWIESIARRILIKAISIWTEWRPIVHQSRNIFKCFLLLGEIPLNAFRALVFFSRSLSIPSFARFSPLIRTAVVYT